MLMMLPGMTQDIADAILDWMDPDDTPRQYGAERDYYSSLTPSYAPKNGPLESVEELLLVRGVTPQLLFGMDIDRNWMVDSREMSGQFTQGGGAGTSGGTSSSNVQSSSSQSGGSSISSADAGSAASYGWAAYLTVRSMESNLRPDGQLKVNINQSDLQLLFEELSAVLDGDQASFIVAYRQGQVVQTNQLASPINGRTPDLTKSGSTQLASPLDLVGAKVQITFPGDRSATVLDSPFAATPSSMASYISKLLDYLTIVPAATAPGRININQAPRPVLLTIPKIDAQTVDRILSSRPADPSQANASQQYATWLYEQNLVDLNLMKQIMPYVTASGRVYRAQVVGHFDRPGPVCRIEAVVDATTPIPRLLFWRDLTHLGRGYSPAILGVSTP
jgi:DNA uptake protein ComE-like DNA-binding protein